MRDLICFVMIYLENHLLGFVKRSVLQLLHTDKLAVFFRVHRHFFSEFFFPLVALVISSHCIVYYVSFLLAVSF